MHICDCVWIFIFVSFVKYAYSVGFTKFHVMIFESCPKSTFLLICLQVSRKQKLDWAKYSYLCFFSSFFFANLKFFCVQISDLWQDLSLLSFEHTWVPSERHSMSTTFAQPLMKLWKLTVRSVLQKQVGFSLLFVGSHTHTCLRLSWTKICIFANLFYTNRLHANYNHLVCKHAHLQLHDRHFFWTRFGSLADCFCTWASSQALVANEDESLTLSGSDARWAPITNLGARCKGRLCFLCFFLHDANRKQRKTLGSRLDHWTHTSRFEQGRRHCFRWRRSLSATSKFWHCTKRKATRN